MIWLWNVVTISWLAIKECYETYDFESVLLSFLQRGCLEVYKIENISMQSSDQYIITFKTLQIPELSLNRQKKLGLIGNKSHRHLTNWKA